MSSASERYLALTRTKGKISPQTASDFFDQLPPIKPSQLLGSWSGEFLNTGHPTGPKMEEIQWVGKEFYSVDDVDPVIVSRDGQRASWGQWGRATLREMVYRGILSTVMIYDDRPVFDHFRYVDENLVAGIMEGKAVEGRDFHFYLRR